MGDKVVDNREGAPRKRFVRSLTFMASRDGVKARDLRLPRHCRIVQELLELLALRCCVMHLRTALHQPCKGSLEPARCWHAIRFESQCGTVGGRGWRSAQQ